MDKNRDAKQLTILIIAFVLVVLLVLLNSCVTVNYTRIFPQEGSRVK